MKVIAIEGSNQVYSSNVYLCLGDWNRLEDVNTLIDVGNDPARMAVIEAYPSGIGKKRVERVVLTHDHSDHTGILPLVRAVFAPEIYAFSPFCHGATHTLKDGEMIRIADRECEIIHLPGHSGDSICIHCREEGILFVGDAPVICQTSEGDHDGRFVQALQTLCRKNIQSVYFGHGQPLLANAKQQLIASLNRIREGHGQKERQRYRTITVDHKSTKG